MPGSYAHITVANMLVSGANLSLLPLNDKVRAKLSSDHLKFVELGSVSPDLPYLVLGPGQSKAWSWADKMHYENTTRIIIEGIKILAGHSGDTQAKLIAWLLGYASHVAADVCVHPMVNMKVGPYEQNKTAHRVCEMHQDVYIFEGRMNLSVNASQYLKRGIRKCVSNGGGLDGDVAGFWAEILARVHPTEHKRNPPDMDLWFDRFTQTLDAVDDAAGFIPFGRHMARSRGLIYPSTAQVEKNKYIDRLKTPHDLMDYDSVFDRAVRSAMFLATKISAGVFGGQYHYKEIYGEWDLDTGKNRNNGRLVFW